VRSNNIYLLIEIYKTKKTMKNRSHPVRILKTKRLASVAAGLAAACVMSASSAQASLIASESFNYPIAGSSLNGQGSGTGFTGTWGGGANFDVVSGLTYSGVSSSGGAASGSGQTYLSLSSAISPASGSIYFSILLNQSSANFGNIGFFNNGGAGELWSFGDTYNGSGPSPTYALNSASGPGKFNAAAGFNDSGVSIVPNVTQWLVAQIDYATPSAPVAYLYLNPAVGSTPLTSSAIATMTGANAISINQIRLEDRNFAIDEIRIGTTFADVASVPEPSTYAFITLGFVYLFGLKIFKRRSQATV
jgi:hypothetical protein